MNARTKKYLSMYLWIAFLYTAAVYLNCIPFYDQRLILLGSVLSYVILICVFIHWMLSVRWRCMHKRIRRYIMAVGAGMIFWMALTLLQNNFAFLPIIKRQLWYLSYIPIIVIPLMTIGAAYYISKPDTRLLSKKFTVLWVVSVILFAIVLTNELHGLLFDVSIYETHDAITSHTPLCWILSCWSAFLELVAIITLVVKSSETHLRWTRIVAPISFFAAGMVYVVLYLTNKIGDDIVPMPVAVSFFHLAICESCLFLRVLPTSFYYRQFFENTDIGMQILDINDDVSIRSGKARKISEQENLILKDRGTLLVDGHEVYRERIQGGFLVYEKDIRSIQQEIEKLKKATNEIEETNNYIREKQKLRIQKERLDEKERLFNEISFIIAPSLDKIDHLLAKLPDFDEAERRRSMWQINLLGTYIKRRANLELRRKESPAIFGSEMSQCMAEYYTSLKAIGVTSNCFVNSGTVLSLDSAILLLDVYNEIIEENTDNLKTISIIQSKRDSSLCFMLEGLGREKMTFAQKRVREFAEYAADHGMKVFFEVDDLPPTVCCTFVIEDGGGV